MHCGRQQFDLVVVEHTNNILAIAERIEVVVSDWQPCPVRRSCELYLTLDNIDQLRKLRSHGCSQRRKSTVDQPSFIAPLYPSGHGLSGKYSDESARSGNKRWIN